MVWARRHLPAAAAGGGFEFGAMNKSSQFVGMSR